MAATTATATAPAPAAPTAPEPRVRGESPYDRITSMLMAIVLGVLLVFAWLSLVYATTEAYARRASQPIEIIEVFGGGGGTPEGEIGQTETIDVPGAAAGERASNNQADASEFEEPAVMATPGVALDAAADAGVAVSELDLGAAMPFGGAVASGKRASRIGSGRPGYGFGPGDGGVRREERWSIIYNPGQTSDEYARQLDALGVELATINGPDTLIYASQFSAAQPTTRIGPARTDGRLYFAWQGRGRKASDVAMLAKAGIEVGDKPILQFYPKRVEDVLAQLENTYRGRQPSEIRVTRFRVVPREAGYGFEVIDQQTLR
jgi:hypothetical protein